MNDIFKNELKEYIKQNFNYDPEFGKKSKEITRYGKEKKRFDSLHFPKSDEISNLFIYNSLKILNDIKPEKSNEKLFKLLSCAYLFFEDDSNFEVSIDEMEYPFKFSKSIINCFQNKKDYVSFQIFNMALLLLKKIEDIYFKSMDFEMYNIIVLFEYLFIDMNTEKQLQIITAKIISTLFKEMLEFHIQNDFVANLNPFFFSEGKPSYTQFLKPKDSKKEFAKNTFLELEEILLNIIKKNNDYFCGEISQNLFQKLNSVDRVLLIEEKNEKKMDEKNQLDVVTNIYNKTDIKYELKINNREKNISLNEGLIINKNLNILNEDNDNTNLKNSVNLLNGQVTKLSKDNTNLSNKVTKLSEDNTNLRNQMTKLREDNSSLNNEVIKLKEDNSSLNTEVIKLKEDNSSLNTEVIKLKEDNSSLNNEVIKLKEDNSSLNNEVIKLKEDNSKLNGDVKNLNKRLDFSEKFAEQLLNEVNNLKIKVDNKDFTINQKEEEIKKQKDEIININKEKKEISKKSLNLSVEKIKLESDLKKINESYDILSQNQTSIKKENENINNQNIKLKEQTDKLQRDEYEKILIGARDFLKLIINDLCFYFDVESCEEYSKMAESLIVAINGRIEIKSFIEKVEFINFLSSLGKVIDDMDDASHKLFPELSFKYRQKNYNRSEEKIKYNIELSMGTLGKYVNKNFDLLINFFNDYYKYPKYTKDNKLHNKGDKYYFFDAIKEFEKNNHFSA